MLRPLSPGGLGADLVLFLNGTVRFSGSILGLFYDKLTVSDLASGPSG